MDDDQAALEAFHRAIDARAAGLRLLHVGRLQCRRGCSGCCFDGLIVWEVEADRIRRAFPDLLERGDPHPPGGCACLGAAGDCRIYEARPHVCRTYGLPLRWMESVPREGEVERRDICILNAIGPPIETLPAATCWTRGPSNRELAALQARRGEMREVALRSLFRASSTATEGADPPGPSAIPLRTPQEPGTSRR